MKKLVRILFSLFFLFLILTPIWPRMEEMKIFFSVLFVLFDILILWKCDKQKIKIDFLDVFLLLLPFFYLLPYLLKKNVFSLQESAFSIFYEFVLTFTLLILRRFFTKERISEILTILLTVSTIYFFVSFAYQAWPKSMMLLGVFSYFGDTYLNSIARFYGTLDYCNASALLFAISMFIAIFKLREDEENTYVFQFLFFVNGLGFLFTFSKMVTIAFLLVFLVLVVYLFLRKKKKMLMIAMTNVGAFALPSLLMVNFYRSFLIHLQFFVFLFLLVLCFVLFCFLQKFFSFLYQKKKVVFYLLMIMSFGFICFFTYHPVSTSLIVRGAASENEFILTDFILEEGKTYEISLDVSSEESSGVEFSLCKLYLSSLYPTEEVIATLKEEDVLRFSFQAEENAEYYYIKVSQISPSTSLQIHSLQINEEEYLINSFLVPYAYVHQLDLVKYDQESVSHRMWYYLDSFQILKEHGFLLGQGKDTFRYYASSYDYSYLEVDPHSYFFQLWLDVGLYGVIYVLLLTFLGIYFMWLHRKGNKVIVWFCIFSLCMIVLPFDCIYSILYFKVLLLLSFLLIHDIKMKSE